MQKSITPFLAAAQGASSLPLGKKRAPTDLCQFTFAAAYQGRAPGFFTSLPDENLFFAYIR